VVKELLGRRVAVGVSSTSSGVETAMWTGR
jgi:hypothetical protein